MSELERNLARVRQLPKWGTADIPPSRDRDAVDDSHGFAEIIKVFVRTWPYIMPLVFGYWRGRTATRADADPTATNTPWSYRHAPVVASLLAVFGTLWLLDIGTAWQTDLLATTAFVMVGLSWLLLYVSGRSFVLAAVSLVVIASAALLFAILVVTGWRDNVHIVLVSLGCLSMWLLQYRERGGTLQFRLRLGCHLVYYYVLVWLA